MSYQHVYDDGGATLFEISQTNVLFKETWENLPTVFVATKPGILSQNTFIS